MKPRMFEKQIKIIESYLSEKHIMLEYGAGGSTFHFSKFVQKYVSIEHDENWYEKLKNLVNNVFIYKSERKDSLYNLLKKKPWQFFKPSPELIMPAFKLKKRVEAVIKKKQPNSIFVYDWHAAPCVIDINLNKMIN